MKSLPDGSAWYDSTWNLWSLPRLSRYAVGSTVEVQHFPLKAYSVSVALS